MQQSWIVPPSRNSAVPPWQPGAHLELAFGSRVLHDEFESGMELEVSAPRDDFRLHPGMRRTILITDNSVPGTSGLPSIAQIAADGYTVFTF